LALNFGSFAQKRRRAAMVFLPDEETGRLLGGAHYRNLKPSSLAYMEERRAPFDEFPANWREVGVRAMHARKKFRIRETICLRGSGQLVKATEDFWGENAAQGVRRSQAARICG